MLKVRLALFGALLAQAASAATNQPAALEAQFRAQDERLLAAVHQGGRAEWARVITPGFIYVEEGDIQARDQFLAQLEPDGHRPLQIVDYQLTRIGDLGLVVHHDAVPDPVTGSPTPAHYVMTETWQLMNGKWMLHIVHVDAVRAAPPVVSLDVEELDALAGNYRSGNRLLAVRRQGSVLAGQVGNGPERILEPETRDVFFQRNELRLRWIFQYDAAGRVVALVCRDENHTRSIWSRVD
jgi:hypothetical protein